ncbi:MAG: hypothetical protein F6K50_11620 [Moorea sp. SIO3I7]|uniref:hypothetical protein n=1 Tax=Moorena sp. SIO3I8 TaxID=2607833 RepID=UPI0013BFF08B|nr:hypothetical protein [Moorena sp. SIO3I8]NEN96155.1 hypothetical protein [Moorena sp. SIO3I7]NEO04594.1 hypothetical protein [Moorena sp. SIO3I8]
MRYGQQPKTGKELENRGEPVLSRTLRLLNVYDVNINVSHSNEIHIIFSLFPTPDSRLPTPDSLKPVME